MATNEQQMRSPLALLEGDSGRLDIGFKGSESPRVIPMGATQDLDHLRFEGGAIRKAYGWTSIGDPPGSQIQAIGEHAVFITPPDSPNFYQYFLYRIFTLAEEINIEVYDAVSLSWVSRATLTKKGFNSGWNLIANVPNPNPAAGIIQFNNAEDELFVNAIDSDGVDQTVELNRIDVGSIVQVLMADGTIYVGQITAKVAGAVFEFTLSAPLPYGGVSTVGIADVYFTYPAGTSFPDTVVGPSRFLSTVSIQDEANGSVLAIANGLDPIMLWLNGSSIGVENLDFPDAPAITAVGDSSEVTIPVGSGVSFSTKYLVDWSMQVVSVTVTSVRARVQVFVDGVPIPVTDELNVPAGQTLNSDFLFEAAIDEGSDVRFELVEVEPIGTVERVGPFVNTGFDGPTSSNLYESSQFFVGANDIAGDTIYVFFSAELNTDQGEDAPWEVRLDANPDGLGYQEIGVITPINVKVFQGAFTVNLTNAGVAWTTSLRLRLRLRPVQQAPADDVLVQLVGGQPDNYYQYFEGAYDLTIIPGNLIYQYQLSEDDQVLKITPENFPPTLDPATGEILSPGAPVSAPTAKYVSSFGDRLFGLWSDFDRQELNASADGNVIMWENAQIGFPNAFGPDDSTNLQLVDNRIDAVDDLSWLLPVSSQIAVLARQRSLMRIQETGNAQFSVSAVHWVEGIGSETPYAACQVETGVIFLAHNRMVYYLSADRVIPIGRDIQEELIKHFTPLQKDEWEVTDCMYDSVYQEWYLSVQWDNSEFGERWFIFDLGHYLRTQELRWRRRKVSTSRMVTTNQSVRNTAVTLENSLIEQGVPRPISPPDLSHIPKERVVLFSQPNDRVQVIDEVTDTLDGAEYIGYWESPTLNRGKMGEEATLRTLGFQYSAEDATTFILELSGDGGENYTEVHTITVEETRKEVRRIRKAVNTTGFDLRFRVRFPFNDAIKIYSYYPSIVQRGRLVL